MGSSQLISACQAQGSKTRGEENWVIGKHRARRYVPVFVESEPPTLKMLEQIKGKSLAELEEFMAAISQEQPTNDIRTRKIMSMVLITRRTATTAEATRQ
jgi:hypothetical protein